MSNWRLERDESDIALLTIDVAGKGANALSQAVMREFDEVLQALEERPPAGLIIRSGKPNGFIAGADVYEFETLHDAGEAADLTRASQRVFNRLESLPFPTVALIHGTCLGGGLELALACRYRIAEDDERTRLGLPEVRLGIHPGFAGTVRLPPLVGDLAALDMILTGRPLSARAAAKIGLVDEAVPARHVLAAARSYLKRAPRARRAAWWKRVPAWAPLRPYVARLLRTRLAKKVQENHYPAPYRVLTLWERGADQEQEALSCAELLVTPTCRNLVHVFKLGEGLKRAGRAVPHEVRYVHVIGAGVMGADIAIWAASKGFQVSLQDRNPEILARAVKKAHAFFTKQLKRPERVQAAMDRLMPDLHGDGMGRADLIIEAIVESVDAKTALFREIDARARPHAILATNTSSIPLETIARALRDPARLVGLHFFNPVAKMQLVEIVRGAGTSEAITARAAAFAVALERLPLPVKSSPGFLVNRILMPYLMEAMMMVEEGVAIERIDRAATDFGMPIGPILLADTVGLDICLSVAEMLSGPLGTAVPARLRDIVERGDLGKKTGRGFYDYDAKGQVKRGRGDVAPGMHVPIAERLVLRLINEAAACLREGVVTDIDAVDAGMVYGTGFAPFLGGPMRYAETLGESGVAQNLRRLAQEYGARFEPDATWERPDVFARGAA